MFFFILYVIFIIEMRNRLTLTEELKRMRGLMIYENGEYKNPLLSEETNTLPSINQSVVFGAGRYDKDGKGGGVVWDVEKTLQPPLTQIKNFLTKNPTGFIVNVILSAGESQIPNVDRTVKAKPAPRVEPGFLSQKRMETLENYIQQVFNSWLKEGVIKDKIKFIKKEPEIGETPWVGQPFCPKDKLKSGDPEGYACSTPFYGNYIKTSEGKKLKQQYNKEQFLNVAINVEKIDKTGGDSTEVKDKKDNSSCLEGLEVYIGVPKHNCNNAEYFVFANQTLLTNTQGGNTANLNNAISKLNIKNMIGASKSTYLHPYLLNPAFNNPILKNGVNGYGGGGDIGGARQDKFIINAEQSKEIYNQNDGKIAIWIYCTKETCHKDLPTLQIKHNVDGKEKILFPLGTKLESVTPGVGGLGCVLNQCATEVIDGNGGTPPPYKKMGTALYKNRLVAQQKDPETYDLDKVTVRGKDGKNKKLKIKKDGKQQLQNAVLVANNSINQIHSILEKIKNSNPPTLSDTYKMVDNNSKELHINFKQLVNSLLAVNLWYPSDVEISAGFRGVFQDGYINSDYSVKKNKKMINRLLNNRGGDGYMFEDVMSELDKFWNKMDDVFGGKRIQFSNGNGLYKGAIEPLYKGKDLSIPVKKYLVQDLNTTNENIYEPMKVG